MVESFVRSRFTTIVNREKWERRMAHHDGPSANNERISELLSKLKAENYAERIEQLLLREKEESKKWKTKT